MCKDEVNSVRRGQRSRATDLISSWVALRVDSKCKVWSGSSYKYTHCECLLLVHSRTAAYLVEDDLPDGRLASAELEPHERLSGRRRGARMEAYLRGPMNRIFGRSFPLLAPDPSPIPTRVSSVETDSFIAERSERLLTWAQHPLVDQAG